MPKIKYIDLDYTGVVFTITPGVKVEHKPPFKMRGCCIGTCSRGIDNTASHLFTRVFYNPHLAKIIAHVSKFDKNISFTSNEIKLIIIFSFIWKKENLCHGRKCILFQKYMLTVLMFQRLGIR